MTMRVGNAPVSWGVYEADRPNPPFAQRARRDRRRRLRGHRARARTATCPPTPTRSAASCAARRLGLGSSFVPLPLEDAGARARSRWRPRCAVARLLATQGVRRADPGRRRGPRRAAHRRPRARGRQRRLERRAVARGGGHPRTRSARALRDELGMRVVVHHHAGTFVETPAEIDRLLAETDPDAGRAAARHRPRGLRGRRPGGGGATRHGATHPLRPPEGRARGRAGARAPDRPRRWTRPGSAACSARWARAWWTSRGVVEALRGAGYAGWLIVEQDVVPDAKGRLQPEPSESARPQPRVPAGARRPVRRRCAWASWAAAASRR